MSTSPETNHPGLALSQAKERHQTLTLNIRVRIRLLPALLLLHQATTTPHDPNHQCLLREAWTHAAAARAFAHAHKAGDALEGLCCYYLGVAQWHLRRGAAASGPALNLFARAEAARGTFPEGGWAVEWHPYIDERDRAEGMGSCGSRPSSSGSWVGSIASSVYSLFSPSREKEKVGIQDAASRMPAKRPPGLQRPRTSDGQSEQQHVNASNQSPERPRTADAGTLRSLRDTFNPFSLGTSQPNSNKNKNNNDEDHVQESIYRQDYHHHHRRRSSLNRLFVRTPDQRCPEAMAEEGESPTFSQRREGGKEGEGKWL